MKLKFKHTFLASIVSAAVLAPTSPLYAAGEKIAVSFQSLSIPFFIFMNEQAEEEAKALGVDLLVHDAQASSPKQTSDLENSITQGVDGIILTPNDVTALAPVVNEIIDENIPVIAVDRRVANTSKPVPYVTADNIAGGRLMGEWVTKNMPKGAKVALINGQIGSTTAMDRSEGVHQILDTAGEQFVIMAEQSGNADRATAMTVVENILTAYVGNPPDVIICATGDMLLGAVEAVQNMGLSGQIKLIGYDAYPEVLEGIKAGEITGVVEQAPAKQIRTAVRMIVDNIRQDTPLKPVIIKPFMVTTENLSEAEQFDAIN